MQAIRGGRVDALVVKTPSGDRVFVLQGADEPYRVLIETMQEGAATLDADGTILYANARFGEIMGVGLEKLIGFSLPGQLQSADQDRLRLLINEGLSKTAKGDISFRDAQGRTLHLHLTLSPLPNYDQSGHHAVCVVATDVTALRENEEALQELSVRLLQSQDEERKRISRESARQRGAIPGGGADAARLDRGPNRRFAASGDIEGATSPMPRNPFRNARKRFAPSPTFCTLRRWT